ncbi:MAG: FKBP-type peptidyl-prolyl cis-trans isomerase, partial [Bacteroidales bacterium]|nr:FKBP-type peptidyl-prolyl cis-trans isomerase [Bacteroidales bacterium]
EEAILMMKPGGKARWIVPSSLAYGSYEREGVKAYSPLIFDVSLSKLWINSTIYKLTIISKLKK